METKEVIVQGHVSALCAYLYTDDATLSMADVLKEFSNGDKVELIIRKIEE